MRNADNPFDFSSFQVRSRRIGRCARCHAPVLADEEHYEDAAGLVHGACRAEAAHADAQPDESRDPPAGATGPRRVDSVQARRTRRFAPTTGGALVGAGRQP